MRVAIIHYHWKKGGVTRVVESTQRAFAEAEVPVKMVALSGGRAYEGSVLANTGVVEGLDYSLDAPKADPVQLLKDLRAEARICLGADPDLWHIHNHALGKNKAMPDLVRLLAEAGEPMLLHLHDFAEDGRPENYRELRQSIDSLEKLYPQGPAVHYASLNQRDQQILLAAGLPEERLHLLSNPVEGASELPSDPLPGFEGKRLFLFPVRALRRKNIGELCLWGALAKGSDAILANTLEPTNPRYTAQWDRWKALAKSLELPVEFGLGASRPQTSFEALIGGAEALISLSVAEGFGLAFLEPWLFGKPLIGRDLPPITKDFVERGVQLPGLYQGLEVPLDWVGEGALKKRIQSALEADFSTYGRPVPADAVERALAAFVKDARVDFGRLDESLQEPIIHKVTEYPEQRAEVLLDGECPADELFNTLPEGEIIEENRLVIASSFGLKAYGKRLYKLYQALTGAEEGPLNYIDVERVLDGFLLPENLNLLRSS